MFLLTLMVIRKFSMRARATVETFVRAGSDMVILGGSPTNLARGENALEETLNDLSVEFGIPVSSSATAQIKALRAVNAHRIGIIHPASNSFRVRTSYMFRCWRYF
tara:strand:- start:369 stop:686 length:318 start_codon:yes stop_codon:yes gene_type:complete